MPLAFKGHPSLLQSAKTYLITQLQPAEGKEGNAVKSSPDRTEVLVLKTSEWLQETAVLRTAMG